MFYKSFFSKIIFYNGYLVGNQGVSRYMWKDTYSNSNSMYLVRSLFAYKINMMDMLDTVTSKMSSRQFDLNLTSIRWIWRQFLYGSFDVLWGTHLTSNTWLYVIIQIIRVICAPRGGVGGRGLGMLFFFWRQLYPNWRKLGEIDVTSLLT